MTLEATEFSNPVETACECDLMVIGAGLSGLAAALFAARRGLSVALAGFSGGLALSSGLLDLLAVHPVDPAKIWSDPWAGLKALAADQPGHPYAGLDPDKIRTALEELTACLRENGLAYQGNQLFNSDVLTHTGRFKRTYLVPATMWPGIKARQEQRPGLIVGFRGLKGFSARQVAEVMGGQWPGLGYAKVGFPGTDHLGEVNPPQLAQALEAEGVRERLAEAIRGELGKAEIVGLPAVCGLNSVDEVFGDLERLVGVPIFEIPTMPPSVPGLRLKLALEKGIRRLGVRYFHQKLVLRAGFDDQGFFRLGLGRKKSEITVRARGVILATGRFLGKGLKADRDGIREQVFGLPVFGPGTRNEWHRPEFFDPRGHPVNRAGVVTDDSLRPVGGVGAPFHPNLFAAGSILARQDWMRSGSGAGLAVATAWKAVESFVGQGIA